MGTLGQWAELTENIDFYLPTAQLLSCLFEASPKRLEP